MSQVLDADQQLSSSPPPAPPRMPASHINVLIWGVVASLLLVGSGVVRAVQSSQYAAEKDYLIECPFALSGIPRAIDAWHVLEGSETVLDPLTTRITGSTDHVIRTYVDDMTGVMLSVLVLFGPAGPVLPHTPQICYPSSGFVAVGGPIERDIKLEDQETATFRSSIFMKSGGRSTIRQMVYHSYLLDGPWSPSVATRKFARKNPGIFKVQIQRRVTEGEKQNADEPIEDFVKKLLPTLEKMIHDSKSPPTSPPADRTKLGDRNQADSKVAQATR